MHSPPARALIIVVDPGLAKALKTGLQACGLPCSIQSNLADVSPENLLGLSAVFVDFTLVPRPTRRRLASLRSAGWSGLVVLLAEDCAIKRLKFEASDNIAVLIKPFGSPQLLEIVRRLQPD